MTLREELALAIQGRVVLMGMGNPCCGDDAAGSCVAQRIAEAPGVTVIDAQDVPENYLGHAVRQRPDTILLIDCVEMNSEPGSVAVLGGHQAGSYWPSTHRSPVSLLVDYLQGETRARIFLLAIQRHRTGFLEAMSEEVSSSVEVVANVLNEILEIRRASSGVECACTPKREVPA